jgi:hypothetical protein
VGEALVSFLDEKGVPGVVERAMVCPPHSQIGPITPEQRVAIIKGSVVAGRQIIRGVLGSLLGGSSRR